MCEILEQIGIDKTKKERDNMKNLWPLIAQQRGVEIGEDFEYRGVKYVIKSYAMLGLYCDGWKRIDISFFV